MRVEQVWRYPVKSLRGERLDAARVTQRGLERDRWWAVVDSDGKLGSGKSSRRFRKMDGLLALAARVDRDDVVVRFPDGSDFRGAGPGMDDRLSNHVGRPVSLREEGRVSHFDEGPVHIVTTASLATVSAALERDVAVRRFRPNLLVAVDNRVVGFPEDSWSGLVLAVGDEVRLRVVGPMPRCVMTTMAQGAEPTGTEGALPADAEILRAVTLRNGGMLGVWCDVLRPGVVRVGSAARLLG